MHQHWMQIGAIAIGIFCILSLAIIGLVSLIEGRKQRKTQGESNQGQQQSERAMSSGETLRDWRGS